MMSDEKLKQHGSWAIVGGCALLVVGACLLSVGLGLIVLGGISLIYGLVCAYVYVNG